jgi:hypothetical protein
VATAGVLRNQTHGEELPVLFIEPKAWTGQAVLWVDPAGKSALFAPPPDGSRLRPEVRALVDAGAVVVGVDLLYQGEFLADGVPFAETRKVKNPREAAAYTFGYNRTLFAQRVHDILTVVGFLRQSQPKLRLLDLVGLHGAGPWVAAARSQCRDAVDRAAIDTGGFRFGQVLAIHDPGFLPGGAKYGDLPGMLAAGAPGKLWLAGEAEAGLAMVREQYRLCGDDDGLTVYSGEPQGLAAAAVQFLLPSGPRPVACRGPAARSG